MAKKTILDNAEELERKHGFGAAFTYTVLALAIEIAKVYVIFHFIVKYW